MGTVVKRNYSNTVSIAGLRYSATVRDRPAELLVSTDLKTSFEEAAKTDDLKYSINYAVLARELKAYRAANNKRSFASYRSLGEHLLRDVVFHQPNCGEASVTMKRGQWEMVVTREKETIEPGTDRIDVKKIETETVIGVFTEERLKKQPVVLNVALEFANVGGKPGCPATDGDLISSTVKEYVENSAFKTVEALVLNVAKLLLRDLPTEDVLATVQVRKPDAVEDTDGVGVSVCSRRDQLGDASDVVEFDAASTNTSKFSVPNLSSETTQQSSSSRTVNHIAYLAFGSNIGHQLENIEDALEALEEKQIHVISTSSLYRSKPMYYLDQADFYNGAVKVSTTLDPEALLKELKDIEYNLLHRVKKIDNGPRSIDLDIILYDNAIVNTPDLNIPHIRMVERTFVMVPLCELVPPTMLHPVTAEPLHNHLNQLLDSEVDKSLQVSADLVNVVPLKKGATSFMEYTPHTKTQLMGILNVTPDSFSDGSVENLLLPNDMGRVEDMLANDVDIIDVGGCSTRPNSDQPTEEEELERVLPVVRSIKKKYGDNVIVSVDTYRANVAEESIKLGADIINDISGGTFDDDMYRVIAQYGVPYVINHTRGSIQTMTNMTNYERTDDGNLEIFNDRTNNDQVLVSEVGKELSNLLLHMYSAGVRRWQIILDPGLGFAKGLHANLAVMRQLKYFKRYKQLDRTTNDYISFDHLPLLLGPSRKTFVGSITGKATPSERVEGTAACIAIGIGEGSDIVRVHDYREMRDVCLMSDAIYKQ